MSISNGNAHVEFSYQQTTFSLPYANITSYESKPIYADDGYTIIRYEQTASGTALVSDNTASYASLQSALIAAPGKVGSVAVYVTTDGGTSTLLSATAPDSLNGPLMSLTVNEVHGRNSAVVSFTITVNTNADTENVNPILSHRWVSSFSLDASGHITRTVTGSLIVDLASANATLTPATGPSGTSGTAPWADLFRKAVNPIISNAGYWRRESQTYAYNEAGNALIYTIVDKQARTNLPDGVLTGTADFTYERSLSMKAWASLRFNCELQSDVGGDVRGLVNAAVVLAQSRIPNFKAVRFERLMVQEQEMLDKARLRFELNVMVPATDQDPASGTYNSIPLAAMIGRYFTVTRTCPWYPPAYGSSVAFDGTDGDGIAAKPQWYENGVSAKERGIVGSLPVASVIGVLSEACPAGTPTVTLVGGDSSIDDANALLNQGPFANLSKVSWNSNVQPSTVENVSTVTNVMTDTRMHRLQTLYTEGSDFVFQSGKASVVLEEVTTVKRTNNPPDRVFRPIPAGFVVVKDDWKVNFGDVDSSGNRSFIGVYTRVLKSYDSGGITTAGGYFTDSGRRQWWSPSQTVTSPLALGFDSTATFQDSTKTVLQNVQSQAYALGTPQAYA